MPMQMHSESHRREHNLHIFTTFCARRFCHKPHSNFRVVSTSVRLYFKCAETRARLSLLPRIDGEWPSGGCSASDTHTPPSPRSPAHTTLFTYKTLNLPLPNVHVGQCVRETGQYTCGD